MIRNLTNIFSVSTKNAKNKNLISELIQGEKSGFVGNFNKDKFLESLHKKYLRNKSKFKK